MKVLCIIPSYYPATQFGGPIQSVHLINSILKKNKINVDVLSLNAGLEQSSIITNKWYEYDGVRVKYFRYASLWRFAFSVSYFFSLLKYINNYDLIHINGIWNFPCVIGMILSHQFKKPYLISPRGALYKETVRARKKVVKNLMFNIFLKNYIKNAKAVHFTSELDFERFINFTRIDITPIIIPNGIDLKKIEKVFNKISNTYLSKNYLFFLGRLAPIKGIDILIKAFARILKQYPNQKLVIAGPDEENYILKIKKLIIDLKLEEKVILPGELNFEKKIEYLSNATMLILPSYSENFANVVIEAMACGCPVVISDKVGIYKEIADNNAGIIVKTDVESVEEGILKLLNDDKLRETISHNGKAMVEKFYDIDKVADEMIEAYERMQQKLYVAQESIPANRK